MARSRKTRRQELLARSSPVLRHPKKGVEFTNQHLGSDYDQLVKLVAGNLWKGKPAAAIQTIVAQRRYQPGVFGGFEFLHTNHILSAITSSGPDELALRAQRELGIPVVRANRLVGENGLIQGDVDVMAPDAEKARMGREMMDELRIVTALNRWDKCLNL